MWFWKIYAVNLTFSSVVEFPIYCESEISAQHFHLPPEQQDHRLSKPIAVFRIFRSKDTSWPALMQAPSLWPRKYDGGKSLTFTYIVVSPQVCPWTGHLCCHRDQMGRHRVEYSMCGPQDLPSHLQWRTSGPEHSSQALLGSRAVKTQTI